MSYDENTSVSLEENLRQGVRCGVFVSIVIFACGGCSLVADFPDEKEEGVCGNGVIEGSEACDDGNTSDGDGCSALCQLEVEPGCGNGVVEVGEECDDGNHDTRDSCPDGSAAICRNARCGDGFVWVGEEECDDGNTSDGDGCSAECISEVQQQCGNGILEGDEQCDDGNTENGDGCSADCREEEAECGNDICEADLGETADSCPADCLCGDGVCAPEQAENVANCPDDCAWVELSVGYYHICGLKVDGSMWCWGGNDDGQLGDGSNDDSANPVKVLNLENVQSISLGMYHSCALDDSATGWCWGQNNTGQIGDGSAQSRNEPVYVLMSVLVIDAGFNYNCAVDSGQQAVQCWGANAAGQIGNGSHNPVLSPSPVQGQLIASEVSAGGTHSCAVDSDAKIQCWGSNSHGQLGNDATDLSTIPTGVEAESHEFVEVTTGAAHTCALTVDKKVYCWGNNQSGQLGNWEDAVDPCQEGGSMCAWTPILVPNLFDVVMIVAGSQHTCAITETQQAWCWGENQWGQLGTGQSGQGSVEPTPVRVQADAQGPFAGAVDIAAESANTCIVKNDGSAWCWGINDKNQITGDSTQLYEYPVQVTDP